MVGVFNLTQARTWKTQPDPTSAEPNNSGPVPAARLLWTSDVGDDHANRARSLEKSNHHKGRTAQELTALNVQPGLGTAVSAEPGLKIV